MSADPQFKPFLHDYTEAEIAILPDSRVLDWLCNQVFGFKVILDENGDADIWSEHHGELISTWWQEEPQPDMPNDGRAFPLYRVSLEEKPAIMALDYLARQTDISLLEITPSAKRTIVAVSLESEECFQVVGLTIPHAAAKALATYGLYKAKRHTGR